MLRASSLLAFLVLTACSGLPVTGSAGESRMALWHIVHDQCVPHQQQSGDPAPCVRVDLSGSVDRGFVIFPDRNGVAQFLLLPTRQISGIESPVLREAAAPSYWDAAWDARRFTFARLRHSLPPDAVGLAVNAATARSQDQLHIHIDCMAPAVAAALRDHADAITPEWEPVPVPLAGHRWRARRVASLQGLNLFAMVADDFHIAPDAMRRETLVVTGGGATDSDGFILLEGHADPATGDRGHGEDVLDASCTIAAPPTP